MALRRIADRVDDQMLAYSRRMIAAPVWQTRDAILACIGPQPGAEKVVRSTSRLATQLGVPWHAVYVETPRLQRLPEAQRRAILKTLKLAQDLGAVTATLPAEDIATAIVTYARKHNLAKLVIGRTPRRTWRSFRRALTGRLGELAADIDIVEVARDAEAHRAKATATVGSEASSEQRPFRWTRYIGALVVCAVTTGLALPLQPHLELANIVMLFLLAVVIMAVRFGQGPATLAAVVNVAAFDFFFVPPQLSFSVHDLQYLQTFAVMLSVGLIIGQLTAGLRYQARVAGHREERSRDLYQMARELSGALTNAREALLRMESERLRNSLLSTLSHDLRKPLTALVGLADSLELSQPTLGSKQADLVQAIREQALRTSELVNKVLDMARLQAGGMRLNRQWQSHQVDVRLPVDLQLLEFDAVLIERVLVNLLENAAKYTPAGSEMTVEALVSSKEVEIAVADNGPGLPPGLEQAIFEKFIRGTQESAKAGIGLGLAIGKAIVEAHGGRIWAENRPTGGARFAFTLPLGNPPAVEPEIGVEYAAE